MTSFPSPVPFHFKSRFAGLSRQRASFILAVAVAVLGWCLYVATTEETLPTTKDAVLITSTVGSGCAPWGSAPFAAAAMLLAGTRSTDWIFYENIVRRVHAGENYYDALENEFQEPQWAQGGFRPTSVFNWRTPVYAWVIGKLPSPQWGRWLLILLAAAASVLAFTLVQKEYATLSAFFALILLIGPFAWCLLGGVFLFTELWAGTLFALSICAYALGRWPVGVTAGLAALFFRELALPYCLLCLLIAFWQRRRAESAAWIAGLALFGAFYACHFLEVKRHIAGDTVVQAANWIRFGGMAFVLGTVQLSNFFLITAPAWLTACYLSLSLLGLAGWRGETGVRLSVTVLGYLAAFAIAGQPYNAYWGLMIAPLLALGVAAMPLAVYDLIQAALHAPAKAGG